MSKTFSAQGGITIKRLRNGDSLLLTIVSSKPLIQAVDTDNGNITPDWTQDANRPILTPSCVSVLGNSVTLSKHKWSWNGVELNWTGAVSDGWTTDANGKFMMDTNGRLKIIDNLASKENYANDTLLYSVQASVSAIEYNLQKSIDVVIAKAGASSYLGSIVTNRAVIDNNADTNTAKLSTSLISGTNVLSDYYVKWYKGVETEWPEKNGLKSIDVTRDNVDGDSLFIAEFHLSETDATAGKSPVYRAGIRIIDKSDEYRIIYSITSANKMVSKGCNVDVTGYVTNMTKNTTVDVGTDATWKTMVMKTKDWSVLKRTETNTITVTTDETDLDGEESDVEVSGECDW